MSGEGSRFKIYTKTGDNGTTSLYNGERFPKDDQFFQALGDVDELNSMLGLAREYCMGLEESGIPVAESCSQLETIQSRLLDVGSAVATPIYTSSHKKIERVKWDPAHTTVLEDWIDMLDEQLPPLTRFILPSGGVAAATVHLGRTICRRAERAVVSLTRDGHVDGQVAVYLNRLSDYLFTLARFVAMKCGKPETTYKKAAGSSED